jgi:LuxR family transcriptional regulator, maltose regulon positive regulatory protein
MAKSGSGASSAASSRVSTVTSPSSPTPAAALVQRILLHHEADDERPPQIPEPLTERELVILRYLPTHLATPEIAAELFVSVNTVKSHLRAIYRKLGVERRVEAVARAQHLGLLAPTRLLR